MGIRSSLAHINFSAGQLSRRLAKRIDLPFYFAGCRKLLNFIPYLQGPARFREAHRFVRKTGEQAVLIPFVFSDEQSYMLEFTHRRMRVFKDGALVVAFPGVGPITNITQEEPTLGEFYTEFTLTGHGFSDFDEVFISDLLGDAVGLNRSTDEDPLTIEVVDADTFRVAGKFSGTFTSSPSSKVKKVAGCATPYRGYDDGNPGVFTPPDDLLTYDKATLDLNYSQFETPEFLEIQYAQANDVMYVVHQLIEPAKITRSSDLSWTCATYTRTADPFSSSNFPKAITFFEQRLIYGGLVDNPQGIRGSDVGDFETHTAGTNATDAISFEVATRSLNSIQTLMSNEDFLIAGCSEGATRLQGPSDTALSPTNPPLIRGFDSEGVAAIQPELVNQNPVYVRKDLKKILTLLLNPESGRYQPEDLTKFSDDILAGEVRKIAYQRGDPNVLWAVLWDGSLVGLNYSPTENILGWHPHKTRTGDRYKDVAVIPTASGRDEVWFIVERQVDGEAVNFIEVMDPPQIYPKREDYFTGDKAADQEAFEIAMFEAMKRAFHLDSGLSYDGSDRSMTMTAAATTGDSVNFTAGDSLFVSDDVGREIWEKNGTGRAEIIEYTSATVVVCKVTKAFASTAAMVAGDWYLTASTITGLTHLAGETVQVWADGAEHPDVEVDENGNVALDYQVSYASAGFGYTGIIQTMNLESGGVNGPALGKLKNIHKLAIKFLDTIHAKYGTNLYDLDAIEFRDEESHLDRPPPLFSGEKPLPVFDSSELEKYVYVVQDKPGPCTVAMISPFADTAVD